MTETTHELNGVGLRIEEARSCKAEDGEQRLELVSPIPAPQAVAVGTSAIHYSNKSQARLSSGTRDFEETHLPK